MVSFPVQGMKIRRGEIFPVVGAAELQDLALTYNEVYRENQETQKIIRHEAEHDALTGALNRGSFEKILNIYKNGEKPFAMIICDIDIFKHVNDTYGHAVGDEILKKVANLLKTTFRSIDYVCRIGGDEFIALFRGVPSMGALEKRIDELRRGLSFPLPDGLSMSASIGIAAFPNDAADYTGLFRLADASMYADKRHRDEDEMKGN